MNFETTFHTDTSLRVRMFHIDTLSPSVSIRGQLKSITYLNTHTEKPHNFTKVCENANQYKIISHSLPFYSLQPLNSFSCVKFTDLR
jgi:hypothetical protein